MTDVEMLIQMLHSVTEYDVIDCGYDANHNKCYAIRNLANKPSMILLGSLDISNFPQWCGKDNK